tara:strand:+ start:318 stop:734 length:417 start_codon:yes stop_codon:yes gene_type:complete
MALTKVTSNVLDDNAVTTAKINAAAVTNPKIGPEFTTAAALTAGATVAMDYTAAQVFTLTPNANTTINITNPIIGVSKVIVITGSGGSYTITYNVGGAAGTFNKISGTYDDTAGVKNFIQITCVGNTEFWYTCSQIAT